MTPASTHRRRPIRLTTLVLGLIVAGLALSRLLPRSAARGPEPAPPAASGLASPGSDVIEARVEEVIDGDTLRLEDGRRVRVQGIDAPERDEVGYAAAKEALARMVGGQRVRLEVDPANESDRYGRLLAHVLTGADLTAEQQLLEAGLVWIYRLAEESPHHDAFVKAQREALEKGLGIWSDLPASAGSAAAPFVGNRSSHILHTASCPNGRRIHPGNRVELASLRAAFEAGYSPGRQCLQWPARSGSPDRKPARPPTAGGTRSGR